ncbi:MAG: YdjY domain-containing protein [Pirellulaceae bacterium]|nr:YdjY domain-containing protein [Pirellulaceae bacterium]MDP7015027.1 YdjY domain-containing protein [Pirellulaceae bacterium]
MIQRHSATTLTIQIAALAIVASLTAAASAQTEDRSQAKSADKKTTAEKQTPEEQPPAENPPTKSKDKTDPPSAPRAAKKTGEKAEPKLTDPPGLLRLNKKGGLWIDPKRKYVVVDGRVSLRRGTLEMFACPKQTKEHESIIAVDALASHIHAALLAVGAKQGKPVAFNPKYKPATGQTIEVHVIWLDKDGKKKSARAQEWIRSTETGKQLKYPFVFAGSSFWDDELDGQKIRRYSGDGGDLICVSNFPSATLDLPVESSDANSALLYEAFTERIPQKGTRVRLVLIPQSKKPAKKAAPAEEPARND